MSWGSGDDLIELAHASDRFSVLQAIAHIRGLRHLVSRGNPGAKETVSKLQRQLFKLPRPLVVDPERQDLALAKIQKNKFPIGFRHFLIYAQADPASHFHDLKVVAI